MSTKKSKEKKPKPKPIKRFFRILLKSIVGLLLFVILLLLFIRSPWGQDLIVSEVVSYVKKKTNTEFSIGKLFITFDGKIALDDLYLEDQQGDTLVYSKALEASVPLLPIINGNEIAVNHINWQGLTANVYRKDSLSGFNYQFLVDAFASDTTQTQQDTASTAMRYSLGKLHFADFKLAYVDDVTGMDAALSLGSFSVKANQLDLQNYVFDIASIKLENTDMQYIQRKALVSEDTTSQSLSPKIRIGSIQLSKVRATYQSLPDELYGYVDLPTFQLDEAEIDLQQQQISLKRYVMEQADLVWQMPKDTTQEQQQEQQENQQQKEDTFSWPDWAIQIDEIALTNNNFCYQDGYKPTTTNSFNPDFLDVAGFTLVTKNISLSKEQKASVDIQQLSFWEASGINLDDFELQLNLTDTTLDLKRLRIASLNSRLAAEGSLSYASINALIDDPTQVSYQFQLTDTRISPTDIERFYQDELLQKFKGESLNLALAANGSLQKTELTNLQVGYGNQLNITAKGVLQNLTKPDDLAVSLAPFSIKTNKQFVTKFVQEDSLGIRLPNRITWQGNLAGDLTAVRTNSSLKTSDGNINIKGKFNSKNTIAFDAELQTVDLDIGKLLDDPNMGKLSMNLRTKGSGKAVEHLDATLEADFDQLSYQKYDFSPLKVSASLNDGNGQANLNFNDDNLIFKANTKIQLDSISPQVDWDINLEGADLYALGLSQRDIRAKVKLTGTFKGNADRFSIQTQLTDGVAVYNDRPYYLGDVAIDAKSDQDSTDLHINSSFLNTELHANANTSAVAKALQEHFQRYVNDSLPQTPTDTTRSRKPVRVAMNLEFHETPIVADVFLEGLQEMDTLRAQLNFDEQKHQLSSSVKLNHLLYNDALVDSLDLRIDADEDKASGKLEFAGINAGPVKLSSTEFSGDFADDQLAVDFKAYDEDTLSYNISAQADFSTDTTQVHFKRDSLLLNKKNWRIPKTNQLSLSNKGIDFKDFEFTNQQQRLHFSHELDDREHWGIVFEAFQLSTLFSYINPEEEFIDGSVNGEVKIINPFSKWGMVADLGIDQLRVTDIALGNLSLKALSTSEGKYKASAQLAGDEIDLSLNGDYHTTNEDTQMDFKLDIASIKLSLIEKFVPEELTDSKGGLSGSVQLSGTSTEPIYKGKINFNEASFVVKRLNNRFKLANETLRIDQKGIYFDTFSIADEANNQFTIKGDVLTETLTNPKFNLSIKANDFQALNSSKEDNDLYFGKVIFDVDAKLTGNLDFPKVDLDLTIDEKTDFTYVVPETQLSIQERDGVVLFVNKKNPDAILTRKNEEDRSAIIQGMELTSAIKIQKGANFKVLIDEKTGDNLKLTGTGDLLFNIDQSGRTTLTGRYDIQDGHYEMNLYNLVKRKFDLAPSSSIKWEGDPMNAQLDIRAIYRIKTSASALMASGLTNSPNTAQYRQQFPFLVYLNVDGELMKPRLNFALDMPEDSRGVAGGAVYGKINQINQQEGQLNKQVFSLLVLNRFYPESGSDGSQGGAATLARNNLNQALSDQLNMFSNKLTKDTGFELNFGVNSYTDYQGSSAQERTDVSVSAQKKLFNDRLVVQAGSEVNVQGDNRPGETNPVIGNVSIEYLLTEDGRWRLRGFRKSEYENIIDGQVFVSGIALIFTREFNKFKELWNSEAAKAAAKKEEASSSSEGDEDEKKSAEKNNTSSTHREEDETNSED